MNNQYWKAWTLNCAFGELAGIGAAGLIAFFVNRLIGEPEHLGAKLLVLLAMVFAGTIEGTLLGFFQWRVLVKKFRAVPKREWMFYTMLIAALGWFLGMLPSLFFIPPTTPVATETAGVGLDQPLLFALLSVGLGLFLGLLFGLFQWFSLRKYARQAGRWIGANALGWGAGLGWIYLFASLPVEGSPLAFNIAMGVLGGLLAGLSVGAVTGLFLVRMEARE